MSNILLYDSASTPVANQAQQYLISVNTPEYDAVADKLINPVMPEGVPLKHIKVEGGVPIEMVQAEKDSIAAAEAAAAAAAEAAYYAAQDDAIDGLNPASITMAKIEAAIDAIDSYAALKVFLKRFCKWVVRRLRHADSV